ncbi:hypothetical protein C8Q73DRAFT_645769 [Cubamyces lactineus]|nr:hypothetical protein C8Q73DRAFT_645769 [Cubamyces lactineus]
MLTTHRRTTRLLQRRVAYLLTRFEVQTRAARSHVRAINLKEKGVYTAHARQLARLLVRAGCAPDKIGAVVQRFGRVFGIPIKGKMSGRTVRRAVAEAGKASDIQLGYELSKTSSYTISGDATTVRHINIESRFALTQAPTYTVASPFGNASEAVVSGPVLPKNRFVGIESTVDHTSETQAKGWKKRLTDVVSTYNDSPLSKREGATGSIEDCATKLTGMGGDHSPDQIKTFNLMGDWKKTMTYLTLARDYLNDSDHGSSTLAALMGDSVSTSIDKAGGLAAWNVLSAESQKTLYADQLERATTALGESLHKELPLDKKRSLDLFLRLGCAMHKDLNSVKGGNAAMMQEWTHLGHAPPVLLANKENTSALREVDLELLTTASSLISVDNLSAAELQALESSTRGGVKLTSLAGALFNHKDDKKGYHDTYTFYFQEIVGRPLRFPDTSNTRYGSHCAAAAELLVNRSHYLRFLEVVRDRKEKPGFTNMEANVYNGLQDPATLTELAVLALYAQVVTHPYMRITRVQQNGLKLGPLHEELKAYILKLIDDPSLLLEPNMTGPESTAAFDGKAWERPEVISTVLKMAPSLPHLRRLLVVFLKGALETWKRFTVEFAEGGAIDRASDEERDRAYMLPTNDHNEGALGSYRIWKRSNPNGSERYFNSQMKCTINETEDFMENHLGTEEDQSYLRGMVRDDEANHEEAARRREHVVHDIAIADKRAAARDDRQRKEEEAVARAKATVLITDPHLLDTLTNDRLDEQLEVFRRCIKDPDVPMKSKVLKKIEKLAALKSAIARLPADGGNGDKV